MPKIEKKQPDEGLSCFNPVKRGKDARPDPVSLQILNIGAFRVA